MDDNNDVDANDDDCDDVAGFEESDEEPEEESDGQGDAEHNDDDFEDAHEPVTEQEPSTNNENHCRSRLSIIASPHHGILRHPLRVKGISQKPQETSRLNMKHLKLLTIIDLDDPVVSVISLQKVKF